MHRVAISLSICLFLSIQLHARQRIITAGSVIAETVCALGDCDKIIASDKTSLYPENIQQLPSIGYRTGIGAEGILSLKPTLVIVEKDYVDESVLKHLSSSGIALVVVERKLNFNDTRKLINQIAVALNRQEEAKKLIDESGLEVQSAIQLSEAADLVKKAVA